MRGKRSTRYLLGRACIMVALTVGISAAVVAPANAATTLRAAAEAKNIYFGTALTQGNLSNSTLTAVAGAQFDMVTPGNEMKWDTTEPSNGTFNFGPGDQIVAFAQAHSDRVRGHNLVWHSQLPSWVTSLPLNQVQAAMETHITTEATHYKGQVYSWDVVNEPFNDDGTLRQDVFYNAFGGSGYIADALRTAHAADPNAKLYLNDYNIEATGAKSNAMFSLAQSLLAAGVPLNGIGFESHFILGQVPSTMQSNMARFAALGLDVAVTELDDRIQLPATSANLTQQASEFAAVVNDCLAVSRCVGVTQWGVGDADSWIPGAFSGFGAATMYDNNYQPKPAYTSVLAALGGSSTGNTVTVTNPGTQTGTVGTAASVQVHATDSATGQTLTYSATGLPAGLAINASSGLISGTPTTAATSSVTIKATDTTGASGTAALTWTINGTGSNTVTVTNPGTQSGTVGIAASVQVHATDSASGQTLTYSATGLPAGLSISTAGLISGTPTTAATSTVTVSVRDTTGASGSATFTWTIASAGGGGATCHVVYSTQSEWVGGFVAGIVINNTGTSTINGWTLTFTFPGDQKITNGWNATVTQSGTAVSAVNLSYNATIAAGGNTSLGFQGTWTSNDNAPTTFKVNGSTCS